MKEIDNICFLSDDYPSAGRMVFVFVQQLVEELVNDGIRVDVVAPQSIVRSIFRGVKLFPKVEEYEYAGRKYRVFRPYSLTFGNNKLLNRLAFRFNQNQVNRCLDHIKPDIVYGHFWHNALKAEHYARKQNIPFFVACGEGDDALDNLAASMSPVRKKQIREFVTGVVSVSTENRRKCLEFGLCKKDRIVVLPNCVRSSVFHPMDATSFRSGLGAKESDFVVSFTGAFIPRKGYDRLSEAIKLINDNRLKVIFAGAPLPGFHDAPDCTGILHCAPVSHEKLPMYLCSSDVFVLPTLKEGCSNAIIEALACGIPVISSDRPFNDDILNEENSIRVDPENVEGIAVAIKELMNDSQKYQALKSNTIANSGNYSIALRARKILDFMNSCITVC